VTNVPNKRPTQLLNPSLLRALELCQMAPASAREKGRMMPAKIDAFIAEVTSKPHRQRGPMSNCLGLIAGWAHGTPAAHSASPHVLTDSCGSFDLCGTAILLNERAIIGRVLLASKPTRRIESSDHCSEPLNHFDKVIQRRGLGLTY
jgi:hypothetical protein